MAYDPNWTAQEASDATDAALTADPSRRSDPTLPLFQWAAHCELARLGSAFKRGDRMALLAAIRECANHDMLMPPWAVRAYIDAYDKVLNCRLISWDEAFGRPYPRKRLGALRKRRNNSIKIWMRVNALRSEAEAEPDPFRDWKSANAIRREAKLPPVPRPSGVTRRPRKTLLDDFFPQVAKELGLNRSLVAELYYEHKDGMELFSKDNADFFDPIRSRYGIMQQASSEKNAKHSE